MLEQLLKNVAVVCCFCQQSEEQSKCDVYSDKKCQKNICWYCLNKFENDYCEVCRIRVGDHFKKLKNQHKQAILDRGAKIYQRQFRIRSELENFKLNPHLANIILYQYHHNSLRYEKARVEVKMIYQKIKKESNMSYGEQSYQNNPIFKGMEHNGDGKIASGYQNNVCKGIKTIIRSFQ